MNPTARPPARNFHAMTYDSESDRVVLFGGGFSSETWAYDVNTNTWTNMNPTTKPSPLYLHAMAYDSGSDRAILFGGSAAGAVNDETWAYDFNTNAWTNMNPSTAPSGRMNHATVYDSESDRVILFGGWMGEATQVHRDTWSLQHSAPPPPPYLIIVAVVVIAAVGAIVILLVLRRRGSKE